MNYLSILTLVVALVLGIMFFGLRKMVQLELEGRPYTVGLLHPACNAGGGGEKVLWSIVMGIVQYAESKGEQWDIVIYSGEKGVSKQEMILKAEEKFNLEGLGEAGKKIRLVYVADKKTLAPGRVLTVAVQVVQQVRYGWWCLLRQPVHLMIDTQGYPFSYPLFKLSGARVATYTHYPFISTDMIQQVYS